MKDKLIGLESYRDIAPPGAVDLIYELAKKVKGKRMLHVNSTKLGGGVAEMLNRMVPLFSELGLDVRWEVLKGSELFYKTTKSFHNALQGNEEQITPEMFQEYLRINKENSKVISFDADIVVIHDPQPAALIEKRGKDSKWLWRCHIDVSSPLRKVWLFLKDFVVRYDAALFSLPSFAQSLPIPQFLVYPSIDPLSDKNRELQAAEIDSILKSFSIPRDKPIILQVSRFDKFKDPLGVIEAYKLVKKHNDCCLVLAGGGATDDPEGIEILKMVRDAAGKDDDIFVLDLAPDANIQINALQRAADVVLQKSTKEGFGLTVSEAMWKGKPVIGGAVGGITVQLVYGVTGFTVNSVEGTAFRIRYLLNNPQISRHMGEKAKDYTRRNFLITRNITDYLSLMIELTR